MRKYYISYILLISLLLIQSIFFIENLSLQSKEKQISKNNYIAENLNRKNIDEVFDELNNFKEIEIQNIDYNEGEIKADISIIGNKDEILSILENLSNYSISKYNVMYENGIFNINVSLE